jgi:hypothetical protein
MMLRKTDLKIIQIFRFNLCCRHRKGKCSDLQPELISFCVQVHVHVQLRFQAQPEEVLAVGGHPEEGVASPEIRTQGFRYKK